MADKKQDSGQWEWEDAEDPIDPVELRELQHASEAEIASLYWAMRKATCRYRIAKGTCGPRRRFKGGKARRKFRHFKV